MSFERRGFYAILGGRNRFRAEVEGDSGARGPVVRMSRRRGRPRAERGGLDRVPRPRRDRPLPLERPAARVERDEERRLEDAHPRARLVVSRRARSPDLAHHGHARRPRALRDRDRPRLGQGAARHPALQGRQARGHGALQQLRVADAGDRGGPRLRPLRQLRHRRPRHADGQDALDAARPAVQSLARARLVADALERPPDRALRRLRPAVRGRARQAHGPHALEGRPRL